VSKKKKIQEMDYLYAVARVRALENKLIGTDGYRRMAEARTEEEALKVLLEAGYGEFTSFENAIAGLPAKREENFALARKLAPDQNLVDLFLIRYDYHNLKAVIKGEAAGTEYRSTLSYAGKLPADKLADWAKAPANKPEVAMTPLMMNAALEAREVLARTGDPRLSDTVLDRACFKEMLAMAEALGSEFAVNYVKLQIDGINLKTAVRMKRMGEDMYLLPQYFIEGGKGSAADLRGDLTPETLVAKYDLSPLRPAAEAGSAALRGETGVAPLDMAVDNILMDYLKAGKYAAFGEKAVFGYVAACEAELTAVQTILAGKIAELPAEAILERLRDTYV